MKPRHLLLLYQLLIGASDTATGILLLAAPTYTLGLMNLDPPDAVVFPYLSYIGAFVLSTGLACFYGAFLATRPLYAAKLETVWLLTAITRACVAAFVFRQVSLGTLENGWITVAFTDGVLALLQFTGLALGWLNRGWLRDVRD